MEGVWDYHFKPGPGFDLKAYQSFLLQLKRKYEDGFVLSPSPDSSL